MANRPPKYRMVTPEQHVQWVKKLPCLKCGEVSNHARMLHDKPERAFPMCVGCNMFLRPKQIEALARGLNMLSQDFFSAFRLLHNYRTGE